jgi:hypothetical protein
MKFISSYSISFQYYFSNTNNGTIFYIHRFSFHSILFQPFPLHSILFHQFKQWSIILVLFWWNCLTKNILLPINHFFNKDKSLTHDGVNFIKFLWLLFILSQKYILYEYMFLKNYLIIFFYRKFYYKIKKFIPNKNIHILNEWSLHSST